jgi:NAD(P)-dependent dehydrogenase (short-subunit alcohol dehydrogenase family)
MSTVDPFAPFRLDGRVVLLTGASSGIGVRFARVLHAAGAELVIAARRIDRLDALAAELPGTRTVQCDVGQTDDCERAIETVMEQMGRIDVLVNNAGTNIDAPPEDETPDDFRGVMAVNVDGLFRLSQLAAKRSMLDRPDGTGGSIVNVASMLGHVSSGRLQQASYAASKGAVVNLTRELGCLWARRGVRVNALCPGWFVSEMAGPLLASDAGQKYLRQRTPMGRNGFEHELDGALLFLCSDASSFVTGQSLIVDGGWTAQ